MLETKSVTLIHINYMGISHNHLNIHKTLEYNALLNSSTFFFQITNKCTHARLWQFVFLFFCEVSMECAACVSMCVMCVCVHVELPCTRVFMNVN